MKTQEIRGGFIRLDDFMKLTGLASTGGQAKWRIQNGEVYVNGGPCTMRGKKLTAGDEVRCGEESWTVIPESGGDGPPD